MRATLICLTFALTLPTLATLAKDVKISANVKPHCQAQWKNAEFQQTCSKGFRVAKQEVIKDNRRTIIDNY